MNKIGKLRYTILVLVFSFLGGFFFYDKAIASGIQPWDIDRNGSTNSSDLTILLFNWGNSPVNPLTDFDDDGSVDAPEFTLLIFHWNEVDMCFNLNDNQPTIPDGYTRDSDGNCNTDINSTDTLTASIENTSIQNESGQNPDFGIKDLGSPETVTLADSNQALLPIKVSASIQYQANRIPAITTWYEGYYMASKSIDKFKTILDTVSGAGASPFIINYPVASDNLNTGIVIALYDDLPSVDKTDAEIISKLGVGSSSGDFTEAYYIKTDQSRNRVLLTANTQYGISAAIQMFLRSLGYRQFFLEGDRDYGGDNFMLDAGKNWEIIPPAYPRVTASLHLSDIPYMNQRFLWIEGSNYRSSTPTAFEDLTAWYRSNMNVNRVDFNNTTFYQNLWQNHLYGGQNTDTAAPDYFEFAGMRGYEIFNAHPEFITGYPSDTYITNPPCPQTDAVAGSCPEGYIPDWSNPEVRNIWLRYGKDLVSIDGGAGTVGITLTPGDGAHWNMESTPSFDQNWYPDWYNDLPTEEKLKYSADNWDYRSPSDEAYAMANWMYREMNYYYKDQIAAGTLKLDFGFLTYSLFQMPPNFKVANDILITVNQDYCGFPGCDRESFPIYKEWAVVNNQTDRIFASTRFLDIRIFNPDYQPSVLPNTAAGVKNSVDILYDNGIREVLFLTQMHNSIGGLGDYLLSFGMWNPKIDYNLLRKDFMLKSFGGATPETSAVPDMMSDYFDSISVENMQTTTINDYGRSIYLLDQAYDAAKAQYFDQNSLENLKVIYRINDLKYNWYYIYLSTLLRKGSATSANKHDLFDFFFHQSDSYMVGWRTLNSFMFAYPDEDHPYLTAADTDGYLWNWLSATPQKWSGLECSSP